MPRFGHISAIAMGLVAAGASPALAGEAAPAPAASTLPKAEVERIVRDYLLREPEIIYQAIQELQSRKASEEAARQQEMIVARKSDLYDHAADPIAGDVAGDVTLVEFFDYHCGYCRAMSPELQDLVSSGKSLRFVFKDLPVLGPESVVAAKAALAAKAQGKYTPFHFALMRSTDLSTAGIEATARSVGIDVERMRQDMQSDAVSRQIDANMALARDLGITGTPSFVIGDKLIPGAVDVAELDKLIDDQHHAAKGG
jgi:protein-disulfide isomerase